MEIEGVFYFSNSSKSCPAKINIKSGHIKVISFDGDLLLETNKDSIRQDFVVPGLPTSIGFPNSSSFVPNDKYFKWPAESFLLSIPERLMNNLSSVVVIMLLCPVLLWFIIFKTVPAFAGNIAELIPEAPKATISERSLYFLGDYFLESDIDSMKRKEIETLFFETLNKLNVNKERYKLLFFKSESLGANAFALPDGTIILTDAMVNKLLTNPNALLAILLHEVGHVENNHGLELIIQSLGIGIIFTYLVGDVQGLTELITGSGIGISLVQSSFSREMEIEADKYSINSLESIGISKKEFIHAMEVALVEDGTENSNLFLEFLSTHPHTEKRIELAKKL